MNFVFNPDPISKYVNICAIHIHKTDSIYEPLPLGLTNNPISINPPTQISSYFMNHLVYAVKYYFYYKRKLKTHIEIKDPVFFS